MKDERNAPADTVKKEDERHCLVVLLRARLTLAKGLRWPWKGFVVDEKIYHDVNLGEWTAFYDWLRDSQGNLIGVRYWLEEDTEFLIRQAEALPYVKANPSRNIDIYFVPGRLPEPSLSCDQAFLYDAVFRSDDGEYGIAFDTVDLTDRDMQILTKADAAWTVAGGLH